MVAHTFTTLKAALLDYTEDDSDEYASNLELIIKNSQERLVRDLDLEIFKQVYTGTFTVNSPYVSKPSSLLTISTFFFINSSGKYVFLDPRTYAWCEMYAQGTSGEPKYFDEAFSDSQIILAKKPAGSWSYTIRGLKRPDYLSDSNPTNWLSNNAGDLLLYAALVESEGFMMAAQTGKVQEWENEYMKRIVQARLELGQIARTEYSPQQNSDEAR